ncbi:MAG: trypsin-like peptidase domain-containing protein [Armatimonadota bacterium]
MQKFNRLLMVVFILAIVSMSYISLPVLAADTQDSLQQMIVSTVDAVKPALVRIRVVSVEDRRGREVKQEATGSGIIIDPAGYVVTNHHVAGHAKQITCTMADKTEIDAILVGTDPATDIAVVKLMPEKPTQFPIAKFGDSSLMKVGDRVLAMGSPLAFSQSVTMGIVSNTELVIPNAMGGLTLDGENIGSVVRWIAHDAQIHPGNSGGPLININGEIIGINEIELGLGGAIPGNLVRSISDQLIKNGKVKRSWIGFSIQPLLKTQKDLKGVLIGNAVDGSPAALAGIKSGDILIRLASKDVSVRFEEELPIFNQYVASLEIGQEIDAVVVRDGSEVALKITPVERQNAIARPNEFKEWGFCASNITFFAAKELKRSQIGVLVTSLRQGGPAESAKPAIAAGDVIGKVAGQSVTNLDDLKKITTDTLTGKTDPVSVIVEFDRNADHYITVVDIGMQDLLDTGLEVKKAWIPASTQVLTRDIAAIMNIPDRTGVRVVQVYPSGAAKKPDIQVGDIIYAINGMPIQSSEPEDIDMFPTMVRQFKVGSTAKLSILRDGKEISVSFILEQSPLLAREMKKQRDETFDFSVRDICFFDRIDEQWPASQTGVLVDSVDQGGWASVGGLSTGDLILSIDGQPTPDITAFQTQMKRVTDTHPKNVVFKVKSGIHEMYVEIEPSWPSK